MRFCLIALLVLLKSNWANAEDGYKLWLRYLAITDTRMLNQYNQQLSNVSILSTSETGKVIGNEIRLAFKSMLGRTPFISNTNNQKSGLVISTYTALPAALQKQFQKQISVTGEDGFIIKTTKEHAVIVLANTDHGLLYGTFHLLRLMQRGQSIQNLDVTSVPKLKLRMLNHWDNLNRTIERGYAGFSIWNWHTLPGYIDQRYIDYARANASIGINAVSLTNVNANSTLITQPFLEKVKALADVFRPYGIKVFLTARFSAPIEIGKLKTADPLNDSVQNFWNKKAKEIYSLIPNFGGFLVKANSEGQPGPQDYKRTHADGANMLANAVAPYNGIVIWRAFVYNPESKDRFKQAYEEFKPLDGLFHKNVLVQVKNGPIDFQPREPFSPLFGAMQKTPLMMEFQVTQEYTGQGTHLVYLAPLFKEVLDADTYAKGKGSTVSKVIDGSLYQHQLNGMAGVSNIGTDINWCSHPFAQANWYALGRMSWDYNLTAEQIAEEWIEQTFSNTKSVVTSIKHIMLESYETMVNYMTPLGLTHIMYNGHHYGPMPWGNTLNRPDWNPVYYHKADTSGIGFDRTENGTNALAQYAKEVTSMYNNINTCPDDYLLWFHHAPWDHKMQTGRSLWEELCYKYYTGVDSVKSFQRQWASLQKHIDQQRFDQVRQLLDIQLKDAEWWRNACLLYFQTFSKKAIPEYYEQPKQSLDYYKSIRILFAPGN